MTSLLRNLVFSVIFYGGTVPIVLGAPFAALLGQPVLIRYVLMWVAFHRWATRVLLGIRQRVEGVLPAEPVLFVSKHQSMYDAIEAPALYGVPAIVLKRELAEIPVWGWAAKRYGAIAVDREDSSGALRKMIRAARAAQAQGRSILIFPEGTRVPPGERPALRSGFAGLYRSLGMTVVPVANDSGRLWPRKGAKRAGIVTFRVGAPIPPGLPREEIEARVHAAINALD